MAKRFKAAIIGGSGYGGAELARRLLIHPDVELVRVASIDHVGEPLGAVHPNLDGATVLTKAVDADAFTNEIVDAALAELKDEGVDVNGNGWVHLDVTVTEGGV